ncbi:MAG TPA: D-glycero-beta-D-manno-heptose 1-phosphate adenylyltransferase [Planctomycetota bacterium]
MRERLAAALRGLGRPRVAVLGDIMLDWYVWGDASRVSPEAPVPVVQVRREEQRLGGAGNVAANLCELGADALVFGLVGADAQGEAVRGRLEAFGAVTAGLLTCAERPTIQKIRVMARSQQMLRVDREATAPVAAPLLEHLLADLRGAEWQALVLSDYGKGVLGAAATAAAIAEAARRGAPCLVDPKHRDLSRYRGASVVTPNRDETESAVGRSLPDFESLAEHGEALRRAAGVGALLVTLGSEGMFLLRGDVPPLHVPTEARAVYDVTGAGDTVVSALAVALGGGLDLETGVRLANAAAGLAVAKVGTAAVGRTELLHALDARAASGKVVPAGDAAALAAALGRLRAGARRVVFTNGCFDILHAGHVRYLQEACNLGDALVVGLNTDASVRRIKGPERPFNSLEDRAEILAALDCVDLVVPFGDDTPEELIHAVRPEVLVKGSDWRDKGIVGADFVRGRGGEVRFLDLLPGRSTTGLAERIRER